VRDMDDSERGYIDEVAPIVGVSPERIRELVRSGLLACTPTQGGIIVSVYAAACAVDAGARRVRPYRRTGRPSSWSVSIGVTSMVRDENDEFLVFEKEDEITLRRVRRAESDT
jgi:hypothetical protein